MKTDLEKAQKDLLEAEETLKRGFAAGRTNPVPEAEKNVEVETEKYEKLVKETND